MSVVCKDNNTTIYIIFVIKNLIDWHCLHTVPNIGIVLFSPKFLRGVGGINKCNSCFAFKASSFSGIVKNHVKWVPTPILTSYNPRPPTPLPSIVTVLGCIFQKFCSYLDFFLWNKKYNMIFYGLMFSQTLFFFGMLVLQLNKKQIWNWQWT